MKVARIPRSPTKRLDIFLARGGVCGVCGGKIVGKEWDLDHGRALGLLGEDVEENLFPVHRRPCHQAKTKDDVARITKAKRQQARHLGAKERGKGFRGWRKFDGTLVLRNDR